MVVDMENLSAARQRLPRSTASLSAPVEAVFQAWEQCLDREQDEALERIEGFTCPPCRFTSKQKCQDLTLLRSPLTSTMRSVPTLSEADVTDFFGRVVTFHREGESDSESVRSTPSRMHSMELFLTKCLETIARQNEQLVTQAATLERLFKAQAGPEEIQTSTYEVATVFYRSWGATRLAKCHGLT
jgi:hypothetical protein